MRNVTEARAPDSWGGIQLARRFCDKSRFANSGTAVASPSTSMTGMHFYTYLEMACRAIESYPWGHMARKICATCRGFPKSMTAVASPVALTKGLHFQIYQETKCHMIRAPLNAAPGKCKLASGNWQVGDGWATRHDVDGCTAPRCTANYQFASHCICPRRPPISVSLLSLALTEAGAALSALIFSRKVKGRKKAEEVGELGEAAY